jgi:hypothetical protein
MGDQYEQEVKKYRDVIKAVESKGKILLTSDLKDARKIMKKSGLEYSPELFQKILETDLVPDGESVRSVIYEAGAGDTKDDGQYQGESIMNLDRSGREWGPPNAAIKKHDRYNNRINTLIATKDWIIGIIVFAIIFYYVLPFFFGY